MKKILSIIISIILILSICPIGLFSITASAGTYGGYTIGAVKYGTGKNAILDVNTSISGDIVVPTALGYYEMNSQIYQYLINEIYISAFADCNLITSVTIPDEIVYIDDYAFKNCTNLKSVYIGAGVKKIGRNVFSNCKKLKTITISPDNPYYSSEGSIMYNKDKSLIVSYNDTSSKTNFSIPDCVTEIGSYAFENGKNLNCVYIPNSVKNIGYGAFYGCSSITNMTIPDSVTNIGDFTFYDCISLKNVSLGNNVENIGGYAFWNCSSLKNIEFPNNLSKIGQLAFQGCSSLVNILIPENVESIEYACFANCTNLETLTFNAINCNKLGESNNHGGSTGEVQYKGPAFSGCSKLTNIQIGEKVTKIPNNSFSECQAITSIEIPNSVFSIGDCAFENCQNLKSITFYDSVTSIGGEAFADCNILTDVWYIGESNSNISIGSKNSPLKEAQWHFNTCNVEHVYSSNCDSNCDMCEYIRSNTVDHSWDMNNSYDKTTHWVECILCGEKESQPTEHIFTINNGKTCEICKFSNTPSKPSLLSKRDVEITLTMTSGYEYSIDGFNWQNSNIFYNLTPNTEYTFYQRVAETEISYASEASAGLTVKTDRAMNTTEFKGGNGTDYAPYLISTKEHLNNVRKYPDAYFKQLNDIEFTATDFASGGTYYNNGYGWMPIGKDSNSPFKGSYDGGGYSIKNLKVDITTVNSACVGLFGYCTGNLGNITIENSDIKVTADGSGYAGGIVGYHKNGKVENCHNINTTVNAQYGGGIIGYSYYGDAINNCTNSGCVNGIYIGGIVGYTYSTDTINNCSNRGNIDGTYVGGIVGTTAYLSSISDCTNSGDIIKNKTSGAYIGGIVGYNKSGTLDISDCSNSGEIYAEGSDLSSISLGGAPIVGGIVGYSYNTNIENCSNSANIYGDYAGGIIGYGNTVINDTTNTGNISARTYSGGIVGYQNKGSVYSSVNKGKITGVRYVGGSIYTNYSEAVGGIVGAVGNESEIYCCINIGLISNGTYTGGVAGKGDSISQCYNKGKVTSVYYSGGICAYLIDSYGKIYNCYNTGNIDGKYSAGILSNMKFGTVKTSYNIGEINNTELDGYSAAIIAYLTGGTVQKCYYLNNVTDGIGYLDYSVSYTPETAMLSKANMQNQSYFENFDFDTIWIIDGNTDYPYPELKNVEIIYVPYVVGDIDGDGNINSTDLIIVKNALLGVIDIDEYNPIIYDVNGDTKFDILDFVRLKKLLVSIKNSTETLKVQPQTVELLSETAYFDNKSIVI